MIMFKEVPSRAIDPIYFESLVINQDLEYAANMDGSFDSIKGTILFQDKENRSINTEETKELVEYLEAARGFSVSMVSLILPPTEDIPQLHQRLDQDLHSVEGSRPARLAKMAAISATMRMLRDYPKLPSRGLFIYCGETIDENGRENLLRIQFQPHKMIETFGYHVDTRFHTGLMEAVLT